MGQNIYGVDIGTSNLKCAVKIRIRLSMRKISLQLQIRKIFSIR